MHEIFGKRFYSRQKAAWHRLGETFDLDEKVSVVDAVSKTTVGVEIDAAPLSYVYQGTAYQTEQRVIIRKPTADDPEPRGSRP